jgi:hypothetical protein
MPCQPLENQDRAFLWSIWSDDEHPLGEKNVRAEAMNIARNHPVFPGDTISHRTAAEVERRGWAKRNDDGDWVPTDTCPFTLVSQSQATR